ncbi:MAG: hypothetical protein ABIR06_20705, partial [Cyclobacteriaceae bacterium]
QLLNHDNPGSSPLLLRIKAPVPGDTTVFTLPFKTHLKGGINDVEVFVNPRIVQEKFFDNNAIRLADHLNVLTDRQDPVIDVTIDERHIVNGDFVSVNPSIKIRLWDETPYLLKKDTLGVDVFLAYPCASENCIFQRIHFSRDDVSWQGATEDSDFLINFLPANLSQGIYRLRIQAGDVNGNSGDTPYEISFQVDPISSVDVTSPFPNPFELETNFEITVTGESPAFHFTLQLLNLDGALVQEYSDSSAGFHIGKNLVRWNGMDDRNNPLPNGIYLYRWMIDTGKKVEFFYGKIVLIR